MTTIRRPQRAQPVAKNTGPRINGDIAAHEVQIIDAEGENRGVLAIEEALDLAASSNLDLVEISPNSKPPVCRVMDYGKYKYQQQKKAAEARKKQKIVEVKEIKMRPNIDQHDYETKLRSLQRFIEDGDKVKLTLRFRGREIVHQELGMQLLERVRDETEDYTKVELQPKMEGRQMIMVLAPAK